MLELSLHILDIINNSIKAKATLVTVEVFENLRENQLKITVRDNGCGMDKDFLTDVVDPFRTTRTTRKVGMGLSLFRAAAKTCGGDLTITSQKGNGTTVSAYFVYDHIDRQPLGNMGETMVAVISGNTDVDFVYIHKIDHHCFSLDTRELKRVLGKDISIGEADVVLWLKDYIREGLAELTE